MSRKQPKRQRQGSEGLGPRRALPTWTRSWFVRVMRLNTKNIENTEKRNNADQIWEGVCYFSTELASLLHLTVYTQKLRKQEVFPHTKAECHPLLFLWFLLLREFFFLVITTLFSFWRTPLEKSIKHTKQCVSCHWNHCSVTVPVTWRYNGGSISRYRAVIEFIGCTYSLFV